MPRIAGSRLAAVVSVLAFVAVLAAGPPAAAAPAKAPAAETAETAEAAQPGALTDPPELKPLKYRLLGPAWGGRVSRVTGVAGDPLVYFAATASGGVWRSVDGGHKWEPVFDEQPISSIGSIAVAPSDRNVVYVGSGEANIRGNVAAGNGIYKSTDGGKSWTHVWEQEGQIGTMVVDPTDPDVAFAAVLGHAFGPNPERGVYRTTDGGKGWSRVLAVDEKTGASDVALDPHNPRVVFAGTWQTVRRPWEMTSGGPGSGLWVSRDGGQSWARLTGKGLPEGNWGKVGVRVAPSDGRRVYALIEAEEGGLFRSDDGGESWTRINGDRRLRQRAWYYSTLTVSPANPDEVWCPQVPMLRTVDGGKSFDFVKGFHHGDHHDLWIDPADPERMIGGNDGGVDISTDGGESWFAPPLPIAQFYHVSVDDRTPFRVAGAMQDIGTGQAPSDTLADAGVRDTDWYGVGGGEAGWVVSVPGDPDVVYAGEYGGDITRFDRRTGEVRHVGIYPDDPSGHGAEDLTYRFQWTAPIAVSPHPPHAVYHGANVLFRSTDGGQSWTAISPDLTRNDPAKQQWTGGPITGDNTGVEVYDTIFVVAESPVEKGVIWAGSDDGLVHVSRDDGASWTDVTAAMPGLPEWGTVAMIEPSHTDAGRAWVVIDAHRLDDMHPYLYETADFGRSWRRLDGGLPADVYLHSVREDPAEPGSLYLGTERGVATSRDGGRSWHSLKLNLPTVAVSDLQVTGGSLVVGTNGRSIWILDDLDAVRRLTRELSAAPVRLLPPPPAVAWTIGDAHGRGVWSGDDPPRGARIYYYLKEKPADDAELKIAIADAAGTSVATLSSVPKKSIGDSEYAAQEEERLKKAALPEEAGINRTVWDLTWDGAEMIPGGILDAGDPATGPTALPGRYTVTLTLGDATETASLTVEPDPRFDRVDPAGRAGAAALAEQLRLGLEVRDTLSEVSRTVGRLRAVRKQLAARDELLAADPATAEATAALREASEALIGKLDALEAKLHNPEAEIVYDVLAMPGGAQLYSRLSLLFDLVKYAPGAPTQGQREVFAAERAELGGYEGELAALISGDLAELNRRAAELGVPTVWVPP